MRRNDGEIGKGGSPNSDDGWNSFFIVIDMSSLFRGLLAWETRTAFGAGLADARYSLKTFYVTCVVLPLVFISQDDW